VKAPFYWTPEADLAFQQLKERFTTAAILLQPNPNQQFVLEVDASDSGVGTVLSQRSESEGKLHKIMMLVTGNYQNRKASLEEWRHRLEGDKLPFIV